MKKFRPRLTYANVMSSIAVFVALGGSAFAASHLVTTRDIAPRAVTAQKIAPGAVTAQKIRNQSVRPHKIVRGGVFPAHIRRDAIYPGHIRPEAVHTEKIAPGAVDSSRLADGAVTSSKLDTSSVSEVFQPRSDILYASVDGSGGLALDKSRGATGATQIGTGFYAVTFERPVSNCAWFPSRSAIGTGIPANGDFLGVGGQAGEPSNVRVRIRNHENDPANRSFSVMVVC